MEKTGQNPKIRQLWRPVAPQPHVIQKSWPISETPSPLDYNVEETVFLCSASRDLLPALNEVPVRLLMSDFWGKWPLKWNFLKMTFRIYRRDAELRFVAKFGENRALQSCRKVVWITTQKNLGSAGLIPARILPKMGRSRPKFPERCHPLTCPCIPNLVRIGCVLPDLFQKDWFFGPKSRYSIGF